jgi:hypothetical protein
MEKTLAKKRQAWKTLKNAFPTFPQLRLRLLFVTKVSDRPPIPDTE